jgi:hypothetical protein
MLATSVRDQSVQRAMLAAVGRARDDEAVLLAGDGDVARDPLRQRALRAVDATSSGSIVTSTPLGTGIGALPMRDIHQTSATTSPPTPAARASWPVITPREVETIAVPVPPWTRGMCLAST